MTRVWREADHPRDRIGRFDEPPGSPAWLKRNHGGRVPAKWASRVSQQVETRQPNDLIRRLLTGFDHPHDAPQRDRDALRDLIADRLTYMDERSGMAVEVDNVGFERVTINAPEDTEDYWDDLSEEEIAELDDDSFTADTVYVHGKVYGPGGEDVGRVERRYFVDPKDGKLTAIHGEFKIRRRSLRGQGLGTRYSAVQDRFYREMGIEKIQLEANYDVGGYAWAKAGYDWRDDGVAAAILDDLDMVVNDEDGWEILEDQRGLDLGKQIRVPITPEIEEAFDRMNARMQKGDPPTPLEVAMLGWTPGASMWLGKAFLLGATWPGERHL